MPSDLTMLTCGQPGGGSELGEVLVHLGNMLDLLITRIEWARQQSDDDLRLFGPFIGRSLLEVGLTALVARLDPFRLLLLREAQRQPDYDLSVRRRTSVQWQGDIVSEKPTANLWTADKPIESISRALLGDYYDHLFWRGALQRLVDSAPDGVGGPWMQELRQIDPNVFTARMRSEAGRLFSSLSKGVHHEFVLPPAAMYDRPTVLGLIADAIRISSHLAVLSHMVLHCPFCMPAAEAIQHYTAVQNIEVL